MVTNPKKEPVSTPADVDTRAIEHVTVTVTEAHAAEALKMRLGQPRRVVVMSQSCPVYVAMQEAVGNPHGLQFAVGVSAITLHAPGAPETADPCWSCPIPESLVAFIRFFDRWATDEVNPNTREAMLQIWLPLTFPIDVSALPPVISDIADVPDISEGAKGATPDVAV